jgi:hypothetical protein
MQALMGVDFGILQRAVREAGFTGFMGEPDLFCSDDQGHWFFAEAKGVGDKMRNPQRIWIDVCERALEGRAEIRVCNLAPNTKRVVAKSLI